MFFSVERLVLNPVIRDGDSDDNDSHDDYYGSQDDDPELQTDTSTSFCACQSCANPGTPYHPSEVSDSKVTVAHQSKERQAGQLKTYTRKIQSSWYTKHPWISVCTSKYKIFCSTCRGAKHLGLLTFSKRQNSVFLEEGLEQGSSKVSTA